MVSAFASATGVGCPRRLLAAGNFAATAVLESESGSCWPRAIGTKQQRVRGTTERRTRWRSNEAWSFMVHPLSGFDFQTLATGNRPARKVRVFRSGTSRTGSKREEAHRSSDQRLSHFNGDTRY